MTDDPTAALHQSFEEWQWHADALCQSLMCRPECLAAAGLGFELAVNPVLGFEPLFNSEWIDRTPLGIAARAVSGMIDATVETAATPREVVHVEDKARVLRFGDATTRRRKTPLLIVSSLVNRYYILDLTPGRSFVEYLSERGFDVYVIDWGRPDLSDRHLDMTDYLARYLPNIVAAVSATAGVRAVTLLGYSMGGFLSLAFTALNPEVVRNLVLFAAPVDFSKSVFGDWTDPRFFDVDRLIDAYGNMPGRFIVSAFRLLKPVSNLTLPISLMNAAPDSEKLRTLLAVEKWFNDAVDIPGEYYRQFVKATYRENRLIQGRFSVAGRSVKLSNVRCPILNVIGERDQVVPLQCSAKLPEVVGSRNVKQLIFPFGHLSMAVGTDAKRTLWPAVARWLETQDDPSRKSVKTPNH